MHEKHFLTCWLRVISSESDIIIRVDFTQTYIHRLPVAVLEMTGSDVILLPLVYVLSLSTPSIDVVLHVYLNQDLLIISLIYFLQMGGTWSESRDQS